MKFLLIILLIIPFNSEHIKVTDSVDPLKTIQLEFEALKVERMKEVLVLSKSIDEIEEALLDNTMDVGAQCRSLIAIRRLEKELQNVELEFDLKFTKFRYKKGIEVLKMVYEKILSLDHHFATLRSFQDISTLSNPNSYPEFVKIKESLKNNTKSKDPVSLPTFLDNNPLISMGYTVVASFFGTGKKSERKQELDRISCLLDFSLSMQSDLKIIYYETDFLKLSNQELKLSCIELFNEYVKVIDYRYSMEYCRETDDWDAVYSQLDDVMDDITEKLMSGSHFKQKEFIHQVNNLEFSIDRLLSFMDSYTDFISQGENYYQKFLSILKSYQNRDLCMDKLPVQYSEIEEEILLSIEKFETAYRIAELKGSKLRDLLYGNVE